MEIEDIGLHIIDAEFELYGFHLTDILSLLKLENSEEFSSLIERTRKECVKNGITKAFDFGMKYFKSNSIILVHSFYLIVKFSSEMKKYQYFEKYREYLRNESENELFRIVGFCSKK